VKFSKIDLETVKAINFFISFPFRLLDILRIYLNRKKIAKMECKEFYELHATYSLEINQLKIQSNKDIEKKTLKRTRNFSKLNNKLIKRN